jgi:hypothetical protein
VGRTVPAETSAGTGIHCGNEGIRVQPLHSPRLCEARNAAVTTVGVRPWHKVCELRSTALDDAIRLPTNEANVSSLSTLTSETVTMGKSVHRLEKSR